jgi:hypothetical protein
MVPSTAQSAWRLAARLLLMRRSALPTLPDAAVPLWQNSGPSSPLLRSSAPSSPLRWPATGLFAPLPQTASPPRSTTSSMQCRWHLRSAAAISLVTALGDHFDALPLASSLCCSRQPCLLASSLPPQSAKSLRCAWRPLRCDAAAAPASRSRRPADSGL